MATKFVNVEAFISRPSFSVYRFILNFIHELLGQENISLVNGIDFADLQGLAIGSESRDTHEAALVDLEHALEVAVNSHELGRETRVCRNSNTVLALHGKHRVSVVLILQSNAESWSVIQLFRELVVGSFRRRHLP